MKDKSSYAVDIEDTQDLMADLDQLLAYAADF